MLVMKGMAFLKFMELYHLNLVISSWWIAPWNEWMFAYSMFPIKNHNIGKNCYELEKKLNAFERLSQEESVKNQCVHLGLGMPKTVNIEGKRNRRIFFSDWFASNFLNSF